MPSVFVILENLSCSKVREMPLRAGQPLTETAPGPLEIMDEKRAPESAHQLPGSNLGAFLLWFLLPPNSQQLAFLTSFPSESPRFVSMDPTEQILGRAVIAPQYNISNLNAYLPGLMELIRL